MYIIPIYIIEINSTDLKACLDCGLNMHKNCIDNICNICIRKQSIATQRKESYENLEKQAKKMKLTSDKHHPEATLGTTVRIPVPDVDRGRGDARSILGVVLELSPDGFYKLGTRNGVLKQLYAR